MKFSLMSLSEEFNNFLLNMVNMVAQIFKTMEFMRGN